MTTEWWLRSGYGNVVHPAARWVDNIIKIEIMVDDTNNESSAVGDVGSWLMIVAGRFAIFSVLVEVKDEEDLDYLVE